MINYATSHQFPKSAIALFFYLSTSSYFTLNINVLPWRNNARLVGRIALCNEIRGQGGRYAPSGFGKSQGEAFRAKRGGWPINREAVMRFNEDCIFLVYSFCLEHQLAKHSESGSTFFFDGYVYLIPATVAKHNE